MLYLIKIRSNVLGIKYPIGPKSDRNRISIGTKIGYKSDRHADDDDNNNDDGINQIRKDIREFKEKNKLDKVVVLWTANTERFSALEAGINDTKDNILASITRGEEEVRKLCPEKFLGENVFAREEVMNFC